MKNKLIEFESINIDHDIDGYAEYYWVRSIPFIVIEHDGIVVNKHAGIMMPKEFQNFIDINTATLFNQ